MAKKSTTGGPRSRRYTAEDAQRRREYLSRAERDRMWQRRFLIAVAILVGLSVVALVAGLLNDQVVVPGQTITTVNGAEISTSEFQERVRFLRWQTAEQVRELFALTGGDINTIQQYAGQQINQLQSPALFGGQVLDEMEEELLLEQAASERGISVDEAQVDRQVDEYMAQVVGLVLPEEQTSTPTTEPSATPTPLVSATPSNTPAPTVTTAPAVAATADATEAVPDVQATADATQAADAATPTAVMSPTPTATLAESEVRATLDAASSDYYESAEEGSDVEREVVREVFYYQALRNAVFEDVVRDVPREELQVHARHILFAFNPADPRDPTPPTDEARAAALEQAEAAMSALQDGEPFADLASAVSQDTGSARNGGDLGWSSPASLDPAFADAAMNAAIGEIVGPVESQFGYHIIQVLDRKVRELSPGDFSSRRQQEFTRWLDAQRAAANINRRDDWIDRVPNEPTYNQLLGDILPLR